MTANLGPRWTPAFRALIADPSVNDEFRRLASILNAALAGQTTADAEAGLDTGQTVNTRPIADSGAGDYAIRWLKGPWLLNSDGDTTGQAVIRPPQITSNQDNYAPDGIDTAIGLELTSDANRNITGLRVAAQQRRLLFVLNRGSFNLVFPHNDSGSLAQHRFGLGGAGESLKLTPGRLVWFFYDVAAQFWRLFALPGVSPGDLPSSLSAAFPPDYGWFASATDGVTGFGIGETGPTFGSSGSAASRGDSTGESREFTTSAAIGGASGVDGAGRLRLSQQPTWTILIRTGADISNIRLWAIFTNTALSNTDDIGGTSQYFGFRYSTVAGDAGWVGISRDGANQSVTAKVADIAINTVYKLKVRYDGVALYFSVNGSAEVSKATNLPTSTTQMFWTTSIWSQAVAAKVFSFYRHWVKLGITP